MREAIEALRAAHAEFSRGAAVMPVRSVIVTPEHRNWFGIMPAYLSASHALGLKAVTVFERNPDRGLPAVLGVIVLLSPTTGEPLAIMEAGYLTGVRTAAASGVATDILAREDASELAILGAGVQGRHHLTAMTNVRPIRKVRVFDILRESAEKFREEMQPTVPADITLAGSAEEAVRGADIVVTTTTCKTPVVEYHWLKPGTHLNAVGAHVPDSRELVSEVVARSRVVVDSREAALREAGDLLIPISEGIVTAEQVSDELGEVVSGQKAGRTSPDQVTVYKSVGVAIQDMAVGNMVYRKALEAGAGARVELLL